MWLLIQINSEKKVLEIGKVRCETCEPCNTAYRIYLIMERAEDISRIYLIMERVEDISRLSRPSPILIHKILLSVN